MAILNEVQSDQNKFKWGYFVSTCTLRGRKWNLLLVLAWQSLFKKTCLGFEIRLLMIFVEVALYSFFFFVSFPSELWNRWLNCAGALALEMHMLSSHDKLAIGYLIFDL